MPCHQVIIIRDGVSESQLEAFVRREMQAYDRAFRSLGISPKVLVREATGLLEFLFELGQLTCL